MRLRPRIEDTLALFQAPLRIVSEANARGHWARGARRASEQRGLIAMIVRGLSWPRPLKGHFAITIARVAGPRGRRLDGDNLQRACKAIRDGVADALEIDDGSPRLAWDYDQRTGPAYGVEVLIERVPAPVHAEPARAPKRKRAPSPRRT